jgi:hypothetical protein
LVSHFKVFNSIDLEVVENRRHGALVSEELLLVVISEFLVAIILRSICIGVLAVSMEQKHFAI